MFLTAKEVARLLSINVSTVRKLAQQDKLPFNCIRLGSIYRFNKDEVFAKLGITDEERAADMPCAG